jgi:signal transduction histidine kinase
MAYSKEIILIAGITTILLVIFLLVIINFVAIHSKRKLQFNNEKLQLQSQFSQTLLQSQLEIQEQTREHISKELHDNLGQIASLVKINLTTLPTVLDDKVKTKQKIEETTDHVRRLIADIKSLSVSLGSDRVAKTGLARALETEVERINRTDQFTASFMQEGVMPVLDNDKSIILFRMAQEILNNIIKHSGAKEVNVLLKGAENLVILAVSDDGTGFNVEEKRNSGGAGLLNLQNRAKLINANLSIQSSPGKGTQVTIELFL